MGNLRNLITLSGMKQATIARELGVSQPVVSYWANEKQPMTVENAIALARLFGVSVGCVVGTEPIPEGYPDGHIQPVIYNEAIAATLQEESTEKAPRPQRMPFTKEQMEYLDTWGNRLKDEFVSALKETSSLLSEQEPEAK